MNQLSIAHSDNASSLKTSVTDLDPALSLPELEISREHFEDVQVGFVSSLKMVVFANFSRFQQSVCTNRTGSSIVGKSGLDPKKLF